MKHLKKFNESVGLSREKNKAYCQYLIDTMISYNPELYNDNYHIKEIRDFVAGEGRGSSKGRKDMRSEETQIQGDNFWLGMKYDDLNMWSKGNFDLLSYIEWETKQS